MDAFSEALGVVPIVHLPVKAGQKVLLVGQGAAGAAEIMLRYPTTESLIAVDAIIDTKDRRVQYVKRLEQVPPDWKADLIDSFLASLRSHHLADTGVAVVAIARPSQVRLARDLAKKQWTVVQPFREHVPNQSEAAWFLMLSNHGFQRHRPVPAWTARISEKYIPALFTLAKDEYVLTFGNT